MKSGTLTRSLLQRPAAMFWILLVLSVTAAGTEKDTQPENEDLTQLDLATLMNMDVTITSAAKRAQTGSDAAAAVFVITRDDIRRSGANNIPELLRDVPGLQVARVNSTAWAISARGYTARFASKLLVLVDGRSIYSRVFSGVYWEEQHVPLVEVERVEIIRGPGGALWGANAVNGVINIITRRADRNDGLRFEAGAGDELVHSASLQYSGQAGAAGNYRLFAQHFERDAFDVGATDWQRWQFGGRFDGKAAGGEFNLQAQAYDNDLGTYAVGNALQPRAYGHGGSVAAGFARPLRAGAQLDLQSYYSWTWSHKSGTDFGQSTDLSLGAQYSLPRIGRHLATLGADLRKWTDTAYDIPGAITYDPERTVQNLWSIYAQDEIHFRADALRLILGVKLEHFEFTGQAVEPTARLLWHVNDRHVLWTAVSDAVRTPSLFELHSNVVFGQFPGAPPVLVTLQGSPEMDAEKMRAYELGWRWRPMPAASLDIALFQNEYTGLIRTFAGAPVFDPGPPPQIIAPNFWGNITNARARGAEAAADWVLNPRLRLQASATWQNTDEPPPPGALVDYEGTDARFIAAVRARMNLPYRMELDVGWRRVGKRPAIAVDAYDSVDLRAGWRPTEAWELSLHVENLFDREHREFYHEDTSLPGSVLGRSVFARVSWRSAR